MTDIKDMTDEELVEAVARETLGLYVKGVVDRTVFYINSRGYSAAWSPCTDMNDLFMVLDGVDEWQLIYGETMSEDRHKMFWCTLWKNEVPIVTAHNTNKARAILEARLAAKRGEKCQK